VLEEEKRLQRANIANLLPRKKQIKGQGQQQAKNIRNLETREKSLPADFIGRPPPKVRERRRKDGIARALVL
jgi:hypothetical protein